VREIIRGSINLLLFSRFLDRNLSEIFCDYCYLAIHISSGEEFMKENTICGWRTVTGIFFGVFRISTIINGSVVSNHWKNETVESTHWRRKIDDFWQARSFDAKHCRFYRFRHRFYAFGPNLVQMVRLGFEPTTLGSDFSINIVSVLAISATRLHIYV
jgi:hypothetical protein